MSDSEQDMPTAGTDPSESGQSDPPAAGRPTQAPAGVNARRRWRQPRYRYRLATGLVLLAAAFGAAAWAFIAAASANLPAAPGDEPPGLVDCIRLGYLSFTVIVLAAGAMLCAMRPMRRARADFAKLAAGEMAAAGLLVAAVLTAYWLWWSPVSFLK